MAIPACGPPVKLTCAAATPPRSRTHVTRINIRLMWVPPIGLLSECVLHSAPEGEVEGCRSGGEYRAQDDVRRHGEIPRDRDIRTAAETEPEVGAAVNEPDVETGVDERLHLGTAEGEIV